MSLASNIEFAKKKLKIEWVLWYNNVQMRIIYLKEMFLKVSTKNKVKKSNYSGMDGYNKE